ncbi:hypothetical protein BC829DRAFT_408423 [Chytridium lagenaria]|nr:hypothetical protein BC829DRAFT_408423 [Chytridium lagenaria]
MALSGALLFKTDNPLNFFEYEMPQRGRPSWFGCFQSPNSSIGFPLVRNATKDCDPGYYCPYYELGNINTIPVACPADPKCQIARIQFAPCTPQGRYEAMPCLTGFYCPNPRSMIPCPSGHYCTRGSLAPTKCDWLSICPAGSTIQAHYGLIVVVVILDLILAVVLVAKRLGELKKAGLPASAIIPPGVTNILSKWSKKKAAATSVTGKNEEMKKVVIPIKVDPSRNMEAKVQKLVEGFKQVLGDDLRMNFSFSDLSLKLPTGVTVLKGVTGEIKAGRMTAIMGPSGAGSRTTFMNVLMGKVTRTGGELKINGVTTEMQTYKKIIGYVPQEDTMHRELTVLENIHYAAKVRLPNSWTSEMIGKHTNNIIEALNLSAVKYSPIGDEMTRGISGGQRKRVNVGTELAAAPLAVFLDEPTSGLDSTSALDLADILHATARLGLTIVSVIHQPRIEIFFRFDDVFLIAPGGRTAYFGPSLGFFFEPSANAADILMDILSGRGVTADGSKPLSPDEIEAAWMLRRPVDAVVRVDSVGVAKMATLSKASGASFFKQLVFAHNRSIQQQSRFISAFFWRLFFIMGVSANALEEPYSGLLKEPYVLTTSATNDWFLSLYGMLVGISIALSAAPSAVKVFGEEKAVYWKETASGHSPLAYYIGKTVSVLYRLTLSSLHFTAFFYFLAKPPTPSDLQFALVLLNSSPPTASQPSFHASPPRKCCASCSRNGGFIFVFNIGANRWAAEAQFWLWIKNYEHLFNLENALRFCGYARDTVTTNLGAMLGLGIGYRVLGYFLLIGLNRQKQK